MRTSRPVIALAALAALMVTPLVVAPSADATTVGRTAGVVFANRATNQIEISAPTGSAPRVLTSGASHLDPAVSPDGTHVAYADYTWGWAQIGVMDLAGHHQTRLTHNTSFSDTQPTWSPDAGQIAFTRYDGSTEQIWVIRADGSRPRQLTHGTDWASQPAWSPDGRHLAFTRANQIFQMDTDGSHVTQLTSFPDGAQEASYAPDGVNLVFVASDGSGENVYESGLGSEIQLTFGDFIDSWPSVSPDGRQVLYTHGGFEQSLWTVTIDGTDPHAVLPGGSDQSDRPSWAPQPVRCQGRWATMVGTAGLDVLNGSVDDDVIVGGGGSDWIDGNGGNDIVCAGPGDDRVYGGPGSDRLDGGSGADTIVGQAGSDTLDGAGGADFLVGGGGADRFLGGGGADELRAHDHHRDLRISCGPGNDSARWDHGLDPHPSSC